MLTFLAKRVLGTIPVMAVVALFVFSLLNAASGDPATILAGDNATAADVARIRVQLGLDQPFLARFSIWAWNVLRGDLGISIFSRAPVSQLIADRMQPTLLLALTTMLVAIPVAIPLGVLSAWRAGAWIDRAVMAFAVFGFSFPVFVVAYILVYVFAISLGWLPVQGYAPPSAGLWPCLRSLILPSLSLSVVYIALIARMTRTAMLEVLRQDYVRTARAKGLAEAPVLLGHALKSASVPIVTTIGLGVALLITGVVVTESVYALPGLGRLTTDAIARRDYPVIQAMILLFSFTYMLVNLLVDLAYALLDPRVGLS